MSEMTMAEYDQLDVEGRLEVSRAAERKLRRERIATAALQGLLCHPPLQSYEDAVQHPLDSEGAWLSRLALKYADTLIAELDRD